MSKIDESKDTEKDTIRDTIKDTIRNLSKNEGMIIKAILKNPRVTSKELSRILKINIRNVKKNIKKLKERRLIKRIGSRKTGYWKVFR